MKYELAILGAGNMAEAIARGVMRAGVFSANQIVASDVSPQRRELFEKQLGIQTYDNTADAAKDARIVLLSVKPQQISALLADLGKVISPETLIISIAAGVCSSRIQKELGEGRPWRIIRTMPNTPMLVGEGMVAMARGTHAREQDMSTARRIFESAASVIEVEEDKINAVTAVSGSGPAYFFFLVEQMIRAGTEMGLSAEQAGTLAIQTAAGAAKMMIGSTDSPAELRRKVTSPNGTTQAAIETMQARGVPEAIVAALHRAEQRGRELGG